MKNKLIYFILTSGVILASPGMLSYAQSAKFSNSTEITAQVSANSSPLSPMNEGFEACKDREMKAAIDIWQTNMPRVIANQLGAMEATISSIADKCLGYSVIYSASITDYTQIAFVESQHEQLAIFWKFTVTKTPTGWKISSLDMNTDPSEIMPEFLLFKERIR